MSFMKKEEYKMTFEKAFLIEDHVLIGTKEKFENADAAGISDFALQVTFTDDDCGGTFYATVKDGKLTVEPYDYKDNDAALNISKSALLAVLAGRMTIKSALSSGEATIYGDISKVTDWKATIKKKTPKKPATEKKKTVKKTIRQKQLKRK